MARYRKIQTRVWSDEKVRKLSRPQPNARDLWLYLLTAKEQLIIPGVIPAGEMTLAESLGWSVEGFREAFGEVFAQGLAKADWDARLVWIPKAIRHNPPESANVIIGWGKAWHEIPECGLRDEILAEMKSFIFSEKSGLGKAFREAFMEAFGEAFGEVFANQEQEQYSRAGKDNPPLPPFCPDWWRDDYADLEDQRVADLTLRKHQRLLVRYLDAGLLTEAEVTKELSYGRMVLFEHWRIDEKNREAFRPIWREERDRVVYLRYPEDAPDGFQPRDRFDEALDAMLARIEAKAA